MDKWIGSELCFCCMRISCLLYHQLSDIACWMSISWPYKKTNIPIWCLLPFDFDAIFEHYFSFPQKARIKKDDRVLRTTETKTVGRIDCIYMLLCMACAECYVCEWVNWYKMFFFFRFIDCGFRRCCHQHSPPSPPPPSLLMLLLLPKAN